jgi:hypothetical protein
MYAFYLAFDWVSNHLGWGLLGVLVLAGTVAITLRVDRDR